MKPNARTWTALAGACLSAGRNREAVACFEEMEAAGGADAAAEQAEARLRGLLSR